MTEPLRPTPGSAASLLIGKVVEKYRVERVLGAGGMGVVYEVRHVDLGSLAALKILQPSALDQDGELARARFVNEAHALSRVTAEGLVRIFNFGHLDDGTPYIIMERLQGQTLHERLKQSPGHRLPVEEALPILEQAASTLATLHCHGVIHRDIKPENIMLVPDDVAPYGQRLKLLDFGIAKLIEPTAPNLTQGPLGTPLYMSPESCRGEEVTAQADVYSLGCVLYQMLCGRPPYDSDKNTVLRQHIFNTPEPLRAHARDVPIAVAALTMQMLSREPQARPTMDTTGALARRLRIQPQRLYRARLHWALVRLWHRKVGKLLAILSAMPVLVLGLLLLLGLLTGRADVWVDRWISKSWRSPLVRIPAGRFVMGSTDEELAIALEMVKSFESKVPEQAHRYRADYIDSSKHYFAREQPVAELDVPAFEMERYEVTNREFAEFLNAQQAKNLIHFEPRCPTVGKPGQFSTDASCVYLGDTKLLYKNLDNSAIYGGIRYSEGRYIAEPKQKERPVVAMTWQAANDYCHWRYPDGGRLPSEIEWEYAARRTERRFPWGSEPPWCEHTVVERCGENKAYCACKPKPPGPELPDVGSMLLDRTKDGIMDLAGSVAEWTDDWLHAKLPSGPLDLRRQAGQNESSNPDEKGLRVVRGGAWAQDFLSTRTSARIGAPAVVGARDVGIRCVRE